MSNPRNDHSCGRRNPYVGAQSAAFSIASRHPRQPVGAAQSQLVANDLRSRFPGLRVELIIFKTTGDQISDRPLHEFGGKGLFTKELEQALLNRQVDFVVHSFKDVPVTMPLVATDNLVIAATPLREDPRDVLVSRGGSRSLADLPQGARVGTGSLRRRCQILAIRPDLRVEGLRGNIDTRIRKLRDGDYDAVILATAGVIRAGLFDPASMSPLDELLSAPGQGRWRCSAAGMTRELGTCCRRFTMMRPTPAFAPTPNRAGPERRLPLPDRRPGDRTGAEPGFTRLRRRPRRRSSGCAGGGVGAAPRGATDRRPGLTEAAGTRRGKHAFGVNAGLDRKAYYERAGVRACNAY